MTTIYDMLPIQKPGPVRNPAVPALPDNRTGLPEFIRQMPPQHKREPELIWRKKPEPVVIKPELTRQKKPIPLKYHTAHAPPEPRKALAAKISGLLHDQELLPKELKNLTPEEMIAKITALLQQNNDSQPVSLPVETPVCILPASLPMPQEDSALGIGEDTVGTSLTGDLITQIPTAPQPVATAGDVAALATNLLGKNDAISDAELVKLLGSIEPGGGDKSLIAKVLAQLGDKREMAPALNPDILGKLRVQIAEFRQNAGEQTPEVIEKFKEGIIQWLQDGGLDKPAIERYLAVADKLLKKMYPQLEPINTPIVDWPTKPPRAPTDPTIQPVPADLTTTKTPPNFNEIPWVRPLPQPVPIQQVIGDDALQMPAPETTLPVVKKESAAASHSQQAATPLMPTPQTPAPQPSLTAKVAGFSVSPHMINALANSDGSFSSHGFGAQPHDTASGMAFLKPATVDALNNQNFTNYLASARNLPNPVTQMVHVHLQRNINARIDTMTLQLSPAELGRLEVKLKFAKDGSVKAHLAVEKPETLALLKKDSHHLEKLLQQTGLGADETSLSFDLLHQDQQHNLEGFNGNGGDKSSSDQTLRTPETMLQAEIAVQTNGYITQSGVNIVV